MVHSSWYFCASPEQFYIASLISLCLAWRKAMNTFVRFKILNNPQTLFSHKWLLKLAQLTQLIIQANFYSQTELVRLI